MGVGTKKRKKGLNPMGKKLESVPEDQIVSRTGGAGRKPKYPWDEWLDGSYWQLESGIDFEPSDFKADDEDEARQAFIRNARTAANKEGKGLYARLMTDGKSVVLRAQEKRKVRKKGEGKGEDNGQNSQPTQTDTDTESENSEPVSDEMKKVKKAEGRKAASR